MCERERLEENLREAVKKKCKKSQERIEARERSYKDRKKRKE